MISLYSGTPRSGKSLNAARSIVARARSGRPVIANFPCKLTQFRKVNYTYCPNSKLTPDFLYKYAKDYFGDNPVKEGEILLIIDECQLIFSSLDGRNKKRMDWLKFFSLHGKLGYNVILISQNDRMIDRQIRGVIEYEYVHRKLNNFGWRGLLLRLITLGSGFLVVQRWYQLKMKLGEEFFRGSKIYYSIYDTHLLFDANDKDEIIVYTPKEPESRTLLLKSCVRQISDKLLPAPQQGKYLRSSKRNELGWSKEVKNETA